MRQSTSYIRGWEFKQIIPHQDSSPFFLLAIVITEGRRKIYASFILISALWNCNVISCFLPFLSIILSAILLIFNVFPHTTTTIIITPRVRPMLLLITRMSMKRKIREERTMKIQFPDFFFFFFRFIRSQIYSL